MPSASDATRMTAPIVHTVFVDTAPTFTPGTPAATLPTTVITNSRTLSDLSPTTFGESDEQSLARQLHVESRTAQPTCKRIRVVIELKAEELRAFREFRDRAGVLEFAELDGDEEIADALDFAEEVRGDDDGDTELVSGPLY